MSWRIGRGLLAVGLVWSQRLETVRTARCQAGKLLTGTGEQGQVNIVLRSVGGAGGGRPPAAGLSVALGALPAAFEGTRVATFSAIEPRLRLRGMYSCMADAGWFKECLTGKRLAVALEADNAAMERAYSEKRPKPGAEVLAGVDGRIVSRPQMEGAGEQPTLIVEKFESITPRETCGTPLAQTTLENTYWKLVSLGDQDVVVGDKQREPHVIFKADGSRIQGSTGCNRLIGTYLRKDQSLTFKAAGTLMACPEPLMAQERAFHKAINATTSFKITGSNLELFGSDSALLARFEAVALK